MCEKSRLLGILFSLISCVAVADDAITKINIPEPTRYWQDNNFIELHAPIRPSVAAGKTATTAIYLYVPDDGVISTRRSPTSTRHTLQFPPGTIADRVSYRLYRKNSGQVGRTIDDVRGTRWGTKGREFFHVYRPTGVEPDTALLGYEWPRDDPSSVAEATRILTKQVATAIEPIVGGLPNRWDVQRFTSLNNCAACHIANKPAATSTNHRLPPWPTDASGLYVPAVVLLDGAPLSNTDTFHDPNANDKYISARCGNSAAQIHSRSYADWFSCGGNKIPMGVRDVLGGMQAGDEYTRAVCESRRYLYSRPRRKRSGSFC